MTIVIGFNYRILAGEGVKAVLLCTS